MDTTGGGSSSGSRAQESVSTSIEFLPDISTYIHTCATYLDYLKVVIDKFNSLMTNSNGATFLVYACLFLPLIPLILATTTHTDFDSLKKGKNKQDQIEVPKLTANNSNDKEQNQNLVDLVYSDLPAPASVSHYAIYDKLDPTGANLSLLFNKRNPMGVGCCTGSLANLLKVAKINGTDTVYFLKEESVAASYVNDLHTPTTLSDTSNLYGM